MAKIEHSNIDYILKWEGGLSKHPNDSAARHPVPDGSGYHTNKGITWMVWKTYNGSTQESIKKFYRMSKEDFLTIYEKYWNGVKADNVNSQVIGEYMSDFAWGSGIGGASRQIQRWLNTQGYKLAIDGKIGNQTTSAINTLISTKGEKETFQSLNAHRRQFLADLKDFKHFGRGWFNRLDDFVLYANKMIQ